jgi:hypothetical protein
MDVEQNDDFYVILQGKPGCNYNIAWNEPIILDELRKWRVALTEFTYYHLPFSTDSSYAIAYKVLCYTHTNVTMKTITINLQNMDVKYDYDALEERDLPDNNNLIFQLPKVRINDKSQLVFASPLRTDMTFEDDDDATTEQNWNDGDKLWDTTYKGLTITKNMKDSITLKNVKIKTRTPRYEVEHREVLGENLLFSTIDELIVKLKPWFAKSFLQLTKSEDGRQISLQSSGMHREKGPYEDWRRIGHIEFLNGFHHQLGLEQIYKEQPEDFKLIPKSPPRLCQANPYLNIFTNITTPVRVGKEKIQLLRSIHAESLVKNAGPRTVFITNPMYLPILNNIIDNIHIEVKTPNGNYAHMDDETIVTLHFKSF